MDLQYHRLPHVKSTQARLRKDEWVVSSCDPGVARRLIEKHHYAKGCSDAAVYIHGLYPADWLMYQEVEGIAWWLPPPRQAAISFAGDDWKGVLALSRLAILPDVPKNAASFLLARSVRLIDTARWRMLVTYADSWQGHSGRIYRAAGWEFCGETEPQPVYTIGGRLISRKAGAKTRSHQEMLAFGARFEGRFAKSRFRLCLPPRPMSQRTIYVAGRPYCLVF